MPESRRGDYLHHKNSEPRGPESPGAYQEDPPERARATVNEIADKVGLTPRALGVALSNLGIKAKNTRRASKTVRIYIQPMLPQIEALLASK